MPFTESMSLVLAAINIVTVHEKSSCFLIYKPKTTKPGIFLKVIYFLKKIYYIFWQCWVLVVVCNIFFFFLVAA